MTDERADRPEGRRLISRLTAERRRNGLTQGAVAARMGVRQSVVSDIESGRHDLRLSTLERYLEAISGGRWRMEITTAPDVDRAEIRKALRMTDRERETYYLASNANMLRLFHDGRRR